MFSPSSQRDQRPSYGILQQEVCQFQSKLRSNEDNDSIYHVTCSLNSQSLREKLTISVYQSTNKR